MFGLEKNATQVCNKTRNTGMKQGYSGIFLIQMNSVGSGTGASWCAPPRVEFLEKKGRPQFGYWVSPCGRPTAWDFASQGTA